MIIKNAYIEGDKVNKLTFDKILFMDGALGTMLQAEGMKAGELPELYNFSKPEVVQDIHKQYVEAGSDIISTNTFGANKLKLSKTGYSVVEIIEQAVKNTRAANPKYIALDLGPIGQLMEPYGTLSFETAYEIFKEQIIAGAGAGVDIILIETLSDIYEAKAAVLAAKENCDLPVICSMTFQPDGKTLTGTDPLTMVNILQNLGVDALGLNCSVGPSEAYPIIKKILKYSRVPVIVQPNAGLPKVEGNRTYFDVTPLEFSEHIEKLVETGVSIVGGCCGTTPKYINAVTTKLKGMEPKPHPIENIIAASSPTMTVEIGNEFIIIGEKINPTGKKLLKEALKNNDIGYVLKEAINQRDSGASILDINVGLPEIDEKSTMSRVIQEVQAIINLPIQIDSTRAEVIETGARICNGRPIINSVNGKEASMNSIFPIAKKYGCLLIGLTLDEKGIPKTAEERLEVAEKIIKRAEAYGIARTDIIIDCLVLTASAQQSEVKETIRAISLIKEKLGVKTSLGISNVSFGLPRRELLNRTFLAMALTAGLDAAIINPTDRGMQEAINAFNVLWNIDRESKNYINIYTDSEVTATVVTNNEKDLNKAIINGLKEDASTVVRELLLNIKPIEIINEYLIPALDVVGARYEKGEIFLPQLIQSAESVKYAFEEIKKTLPREYNSNREKVIVATVKGDIHDIGKNIVKVLLENYGFNVIDLGKDVPAELIVQKVKEEGVTLIGLSALMTTTVVNMQETITLLKKECPSCKVMVGGAVLTQGYADMIGADYYAKDAQGAVSIARNYRGQFSTF